MTTKKKGDLPKCHISLFLNGDKKIWVGVEWTDRGRARVSARITKALKWEGYEAHTGRDYRYPGLVPEGHPGQEGPARRCVVLTPAPLELVEKISSEHFLNVEVDRTIPEESRCIGTSIDLIDLPGVKP